MLQSEPSSLMQLALGEHASDLVLTEHGMCILVLLFRLGLRTRLALAHRLSTFTPVRDRRLPTEWDRRRNRELTRVMPKCW